MTMNPQLLGGRYELGDTLGYGGMSEVHHGHDIRLGREVAVKILRADLARDTVFQERFRREAQNSAALNHPAIVAVYDTGEADTENGRLPFIVMEYVEGRTLRDIVKTEGPMDGKRAMEVMADVCAALDFSHRHGIVHRDVKPANVMISKSGAVKVMDFGIARAIHDGQAAMTQTAAVIGTAQYLSPEQARGESVDARSDVYAAGCVLYELLVGDPPFTGDSPVAVAYQHVREDPVPPSQVNPAVSPELDAVVLKALTKGPANRYQSAAEMRSDLVRVLSDLRPSAPMVMTDADRTQVMGSSGNGHPIDEYDDLDAAEEAEERARRRKRLFAVLAVLAVVGIALIMWLLNPFGSGARVEQVPNIVGEPINQAENRLLAIGFDNIEKQEVVCRPMAIGEEPPCDPTEQPGRVFAVDPAVGTSMVVTERIIVSFSAPVPEHTMPELVNMSQDDAEDELESINLFLDPNVGEVDNNDPDRAGRVAEQTPEAGETVTEGSTVKLSVFAEPEMVEVVDYTGRSFDTAKAGLEAAGFTVERREVDSEESRDTVVGQDPRSGEAVKGSTVVVDVSNAANAPMDMPDVIDRTEEQAKRDLSDAGHQGNVEIRTREVNDPDRDGRVSASDPNAGSEMRRSDTVTLTVDQYVDEGDNPGDPGDDDEGGGGGIFPPNNDGNNRPGRNG